MQTLYFVIKAGGDHGFLKRVDDETLINDDNALVEGEEIHFYAGQTMGNAFKNAMMMKKPQPEDRALRLQIKNRERIPEEFEFYPITRADRVQMDALWKELKADARIRARENSAFGPENHCITAALKLVNDAGYLAPWHVYLDRQAQQPQLAIPAA